MKIKVILAWYDLFFGSYWDRDSRRFYLMIPMIGICLRFKPYTATTGERLKTTQEWLDKFQSKVAELTIENLKLKSLLAVEQKGEKNEQT